MSQAKQLIVSGDDFGMSSGVNVAVLRAHQEGILTEASLMVNGAAADEAVAQARRTPSLSVGLHLVLAQGRATLPQSEISALVDANGYFRAQPIRAGLRYFLKHGAREQLRREISAQIERFLETGLPLSHVDGHVNIHMHPTVLKILLSLAERYGIKALRMTHDPLLLALRLNRRHAARKVAEGLTFAVLAAHARAQMDTHGIRHPDRVFGLHQSGCLTEPYLLRLLRHVGRGVTEIYCHPALPDPEARRWRPADYESYAELAALTNPRVSELIRELAIERINYRHLVAAPREGA